jgi:hypothetical protein
MRTKIIAVNAIIVAIVGLLAFFIVRSSLGNALSNSSSQSARATQDATTAAAKLQLGALQLERWLTAKAQEGATQEVISRATAEARGNAATALCDRLASEAKSLSFTPAIVSVIDLNGKFVGRNGSSLLRGEDAASRYVSFKAALARGAAGSDVWLNKERNDQYIMSYAPIRDTSDKVVGVLALGVTLTDQLSRVSEGLAGQGLVLAVADGDAPRAAATKAQDDVKARLETDAMGLAKTALASGATSNDVAGVMIAAVPLESFGDGKHAAILSAGPRALVEGLDSIPLTILGIMVFGIAMVVVAGYMLGTAISAPIAKLEEGLLAIINGQHDKRFNMEDSDLGGLAFRIDQLLNKLMGIEEDTTDADGRVSNNSIVPAPSFKDLEEKQADPSADPAFALALANEAPEAYYARLFAEYISAKKAIGEATDHITETTFSDRIKGMETDAGEKHGRKVRYHVRSTGREVVLVAIPL